MIVRCYWILQMLVEMRHFQAPRLQAAKTTIEHFQEGMSQTWTIRFLKRWKTHAPSGADAAVRIEQMNLLPRSLHVFVNSVPHLCVPLQRPSALGCGDCIPKVSLLVFFDCMATYSLHLAFTSAWLKINSSTNGIWPADAAQCRGAHRLEEIRESYIILKPTYSSSLA